MAGIIPHLWFAEHAEEAVAFYVGLIPDSRIENVATMPADTPSGPEGSVKLIDFTLGGQPWVAFEAGHFEPFTHAISLLVPCDSQSEIDRIADALAEGGSVEPCGWVKDRWGLSWQIVPKMLANEIRGPDRDRARRVTQAMLGMTRLDIAALERAARGEG